MKRFLTGIVAGLAIGYLTAPRPGKETRGQLADAANKQTGGLKDQWTKAIEQINQLVEELKTQSGLFKSEGYALADKVKDKANQSRNEAISTKNQAKSEYNDEVENTADAAKAGVSKAEEALKL